MQSSDRCSSQFPRYGLPWAKRAQKNIYGKCQQLRFQQRELPSYHCKATTNSICLKYPRKCTNYVVQASLKTVFSVTVLILIRVRL